MSSVGTPVFLIFSIKFIAEYNKLNQEGKAAAQSQLRDAKELRKNLAENRKQLEAQLKLVADIGDEYDEQVKQQRKILFSF